MPSPGLAGTGPWWRAGLVASVLAALLLALAMAGLPWAAGRWQQPWLAALAAQAYWLYAAAGLMFVIGWGDSLVAYRLARHGRGRTAGR